MNFIVFGQSCLSTNGRETTGLHRITDRVITDRAATRAAFLIDAGANEMGGIFTGVSPLTRHIARIVPPPRCPYPLLHKSTDRTIKPG